jgi:hypothetical protein
MGVFTSGGMNFAAISTEMRKTMLPWMNATIQIVDPNIAESNWDPFTNTETGGEPTVIWQGKARIQQLTRFTPAEVGYDSTTNRKIRLQVPMDPALGFIRKGLQVIVLDGGSDIELEQLQFVVMASINSSYAWNRTIECEVDLKSVANSTWSGIAGTVMNATSVAIADAIVRTFHHENNLWLLDYETTTDVYGNYELPADAGVPVAIVVTHPDYADAYYDGTTSFDLADTVTPVNHVETQNIDFVLEVV